MNQVAERLESGEARQKQKNQLGVFTRIPSPGPTGSESDSVSQEGPRGLQYQQGPK